MHFSFLVDVCHGYDVCTDEPVGPGSVQFNLCDPKVRRSIINIFIRAGYAFSALESLFRLVGHTIQACFLVLSVVSLRGQCFATQVQFFSVIIRRCVSCVFQMWQDLLRVKLK